MSGGRSLAMRELPLHDQPERERFAGDALPWVHAAGKPYVDWFFGSEDAARSALVGWMCRQTSEVYLGRATLLLQGNRPVGGFIALSGAELRRCRVHDALSAVKAAGPAQRVCMQERVREGGRLFTGVDDGALYLSKIGLVETVRGRGLAPSLLERFLAAGSAAGFRSFCLDVWTGNAAAMALYRSAGFDEIAVAGSEKAGMTYARMALGMAP